MLLYGFRSSAPQQRVLIVAYAGPASPSARSPDAPLFKRHQGHPVLPHEISYRGCLTVLSGRGGRPRSPRDPGLAALRRAARAALVASSAFAVAQLALRNTQFTTFVVYGCFALLVLGNFGGRRRPRAAAYVGATLVGALLVALGMLATPLPWAAALAMFLVGFWVQFAGVFGSYAAAAQTALQLSFVLA